VLKYRKGRGSSVRTLLSVKQSIDVCDTTVVTFSHSVDSVSLFFCMSKQIGYVATYRGGEMKRKFIV